MSREVPICCPNNSDFYTQREIQSIEHLYKIGFSKVDVKERIKNAENEPIYLMAPVSIVSAYECYNMNPHKLEQLLHRFFGTSCLSIDIFDHEGQRHSPREWFIAPLDIIEKSIEMILTGDVLNYRYDSALHMIVGRKDGGLDKDKGKAEDDAMATSIAKNAK